MSNNPLYIDIHILQSVPPSNINRDDTGSPKTAKFGGVTRARVSSQAWKKATRDLFPDYLDEDKLAYRTKHVVGLISDAIRERMPEASEGDAIEKAKEVLVALGFKLKKEENEYLNEYLIFIGTLQIGKLAELAIQALRDGEKVDKKEAKKILDVKRSPALNAVDIAMFGRMVADAPDLNVDASVQVAHAISVSSAETEFDYFTALDDKAPEDNAGAAMIETTEFTSAMFYRYASVDVFHLCENLGSPDAATKGISAFLQSFVKSMPTGKQNSFANRTLPSAVIIQLRDSQPVSLVNSFERPVVALRDKSQLTNAAEALVAQEKAIDEAFGVTPQHTFVVAASPDVSVLRELADGDPMGLDDAVDQIIALCSDYLSGCGFHDEEREQNDSLTA